MIAPRKILCSDTKWHTRYFKFVAANFAGANAAHWRLWRDRGGWTENYEVFALVDGDRIVSTVGRTRMRLVIHGETQTGYQLGAVATLAQYRRRGFARQLLDWVVEGVDEPGQPIILFANRSVIDFYPRFGFRRIPQLRFTAPVSIMPAGTRARRCDPASAADRSILADLCARARPTGSPLTARDYFPVLLWHLSCRPLVALWLPAFDAAVVAVADGDRLVVHDLIASQPFDLHLVLPALVAHPVTELEFCFNPGDWCAANRSELDDTDEPLFARGATPIAGPVRCPDTAHT